MKNYLKEIIIILLLVLAIVIVVGVFLYDYIPTNKMVPVIEPYNIPDNIKNEIQENVTDDNKDTVIIYEIDEKDLNNYEKGKDYNKGKINPFSSYSGEVEAANQNSGNSETNSSNGSSSNKEENNQSSSNSSSTLK